MATTESYNSRPLGSRLECRQSILYPGSSGYPYGFSCCCCCCFVDVFLSRVVFSHLLNYLMNNGNTCAVV